MKWTLTNAIYDVRQLIKQIRRHPFGLTEDEDNIVDGAEDKMRSLRRYTLAKKISDMTREHIMFQCHSYQRLLQPILNRLENISK